MLTKDQFAHHARFLGWECRDKVTGFVGVGASLSFDVYGCIQTCLTPKFVAGDKELRNSMWFDNNRLEKMPDTAQVMTPQFLEADRYDPPRRRDAPGGFSSKPGR